MVSRLAFFALAALASVVSVSADVLSLKVTGPEKVDDISDLHLKATLKNTGTSALTLVNDPRSVLSTTPTDAFAISHESGANPDFTGVIVLYTHDLAIKEGDITTLKPGQSIDITHSLADAYNFTNSGPGTYEISPSTMFYAVADEGGFGRLAIPQQSSQEKRDTLLTKRATFSGCTADQQTQINAAITAAVNYVSDAITYLNAHKTPPAPRFTTWFGTLTSSSHATVLSHFNNLATAGSFTTWTYTCGNADNLASVSPSRYKFVNIGRWFWSQSTTGDFSKGAILVHEGTHFTVVAGTKDLKGPQEQCRELARTDPAKAMQNSYSHQYFVSNTPPLA